MNMQPISNMSVEEFLPQRKPFVFVDKILFADKNYKEIIAEYTFLSDSIFLKGHFPNNPVVPGVLVVEALSQVSIICGSYFNNQNKTTKDRVEHLIFEMNIQFHQKVLPDQQIYLKSKLLNCIGSISVFKVKAYDKNGKIIVTGEVKGVAHLY